ncbi:hypothetical protein H4V96_000041 [Janthinobacterium sp. CG_23.4]|nr:hypothetical protein [Janthinobacterium sp. CG_23.4]
MDTNKNTNKNKVSQAVIEKQRPHLVRAEFRAGTSTGRVVRLANWEAASEIGSSLSELVPALHLVRVAVPGGRVCRRCSVPSC